MMSWKIDYEKIDKEFIYEELNYLIDNLTDREAKAIRLRYFDQEPFRLIGAELRISATRASQIVGKAIRKMRHPSRSKKLDMMLMGETEFEYEKRHIYKERISQKKVDEDNKKTEKTRENLIRAVVYLEKIVIQEKPPEGVYLTLAYDCTWHLVLPDSYQESQKQQIYSWMLYLLNEERKIRKFMD